MRGLLAAVPDLSREEAREAAERELRKPMYDDLEPSLTYRVLRAAYRFIQRVMDTAGDASPGGLLGLLGLALVLAAIGLAIAYKVGPLRGSATVFSGGGSGRLLPAADHRALADRHAAAGEWPEAIRERLRAVVRELESRGLLEPRAGRTADEVAREAGAAVPELAADLAAAARTFDEVWYGRRPGTPDGDQRLRALDERVRRTRLTVRSPA